MDLRNEVISRQSLRQLFSLAVMAAGLASAQFAGLSTNYEGSKVFFISTLPFKGSTQPRHGKVFVADRSGVRLLRSREPAPVPPESWPCSIGDLFRYTSTEASSDGEVLAFQMSRDIQICMAPLWSLGSSLVVDGNDRDRTAIVRISASGKKALAVSVQTRRPEPATIVWLDLITGVETLANVPQTSLGSHIWVPVGPGRIIADDGTAILNRGDGGLVIKPGQPPEPFPRDDHPVAISADARKVLHFGAGGLRIYDRDEKSDRLILANVFSTLNGAMSDDGRRVASVFNATLHFHDGYATRVLRRDVQTATLSGDGRIIFAVTTAGQLLRIDADSGNVEEWIARTPYIVAPLSSVEAGFFTTLSSAGFDPETMTVSINGTRAVASRASVDSLRVLVPWNSPADSTVRVSPAGAQSPFDEPEVPMRVFSSARAGVVVHEGWDRQVNNADPPRVGEVVHIYAAGLGPVTPEEPHGEPAPSAEPLARLSAPLTCAGHEVLYAGLAPGARERIYQVDLKLGPTPGFQQVFCRSTALREPLALTFLIQP